MADYERDLPLEESPETVVSASRGENGGNCEWFLSEPTR